MAYVFTIKVMEGIHVFFSRFVSYPKLTFLLYVEITQAILPINFK